jgi:hypothetical protein
VNLKYTQDGEKMDELKNIFEQAVQRKVEEIKESSPNYGDAIKKVDEMYWDQRGKFESFFMAEVRRQLHLEMKQSPINTL